MRMELVIFGAVLVVVAVIVIGIYNRLVGLRQSVRQGWPISMRSCASGTI
jgi:hypothetical protein